MIELIIVISIIGILAVALGFEFTGWIGGYRVESQMKELYIDLMNARTRAMQRNRMHFASLTATQYTIREDIDPWPDGDNNLTAGDNVPPAPPAVYNDPIPLLQRNLDPQYPIFWNGGAQASFTTKGLSNVNKTICSNTDVEADYNCIEISASRINLGRLTTLIPDGGACDAANCVAR